MESTIRHFARVTAFVACAAFFGAPSVSAQTYPTKPVRVVVPFAAGGGTDVLARRVMHRFTAQLGQQFVVDNRGGAGGLIGIELVVKAEPDGYTILFVSGSFPATLALFRPASDPINNLAAIGEICTTPYLLVTHPSLPPTFKQVLELARSKPGQLLYATPGVGTISHLITEHILRTAGVTMRHVPYRGVALILNDLFSGQVQVYIGGLSSVISHARSGKVRALAMSTAERWPAAPEVPTMAETLPGYFVESWFGVLAPKGTPRAVIAQLNRTIHESLKDRELLKNLDLVGMAPSAGTPEQFTQRFRGDYERWVNVIKEAGIKVN